MKKAELTLTGKADARKQVMLFGNGESFDEDTRTWNNTVQYTYSWQGDPGGFDWKRRAGADKEYYVQLPRFSFAGPLAAAAAPRGVLPRFPRGGQVARRRSRLPGGAARRLDLPRRRLLGGDGRRTCARR